jgi:hypothetical protein
MYRTLCEHTETPSRKYTDGVSWTLFADHKADTTMYRYVSLNTNQFRGAEQSALRYRETDRR